MSKSREQLNSFLKSVNIEGKAVLDVGVQDKKANRLTIGEPTIYHTLDIDPQWEPDILGDLNELISSWVLNIKEATPLPLANGGLPQYDCIFCIETLEHCWNPFYALANLKELLKPGGLLYISTPFINPHHDYVDYLRYTHEWYEKVLPMYELEILELKERVATIGREHLEAFFKLESMRVSKIRPEYGRYTYPIGYYVVARKVLN